ncbi:MAG: hypothetical protein WCD35_18585 [Mycobacteriales bacterium]
MGVLLAFFVGWTAGAKAGSKGFDEVVDALKTVKESEEFAALVAIARTQLAGSLRELSKLVSGERPAPDPVDLLDRVQRLAGPRSS